MTSLMMRVAPEGAYAMMKCEEDGRYMRAEATCVSDATWYLVHPWCVCKQQCTHNTGVTIRVHLLWAETALKHASVAARVVTVRMVNGPVRGLQRAQGDAVVGVRCVVWVRWCGVDVSNRVHHPHECCPSLVCVTDTNGPCRRTCTPTSSR